MSLFGARIPYVFQLCQHEFGNDYVYEPMREVVNAAPEPDPTRVELAGAVRAIIVEPGITISRGMRGLAAMHPRDTTDPRLHYFSKDRLVDVRRFDRFTLTGPNTYPFDTPRRYEVSGDPLPIGFGWYKADLIILTPTIEPSIDYDAPF